MFFQLLNVKWTFWTEVLEQDDQVWSLFCVCKALFDPVKFSSQCVLVPLWFTSVFYSRRETRMDIVFSQKCEEMIGSSGDDCRVWSGSDSVCLLLRAPSDAWETLKDVSVGGGNEVVNCPFSSVNDLFASLSFSRSMRQLLLFCHHGNA